MGLAYIYDKGGDGMEDVLVDRTKYNDNYIKYLYELALLDKIRNKEMVTEEESRRIKKHIENKYNIRD